MSDLIPVIRRHRAVFGIAFDTTAWLLSFALFAWLRLDTEVASVPWTWIGLVAVATAIVYILLARVGRLHHGRAVTASADELVLLSVVVLGTTLIVFTANLALQWIPRSVPAGAGLLTLVLAHWGRSAWSQAASPRQLAPRPEG